MAKKPEITIATYQDLRRKKKDGTYPIKIRIYHKGEQKYVGLPISLSKEDYLKATKRTAKGNLQEVKFYLEDEVRRATKIIDQMEVYSFPKFKQLFLSDSTDMHSISEAVQLKMDDLIAQGGSLSTVDVYKYMLRSLLSFNKGKEFRLTDVTQEFLANYERYMLSQKRSIATIGMYLRSLRHLINYAINEQGLKMDNPFGANRYKTKTESKVKEYLNSEQIERIVTFPCPERSAMDFARDLWVFSFLANGMNVADIVELRKDSIQGNEIRFIRKKTKNSVAGAKPPIRVTLNAPLMRIIEKWGCKDLSKPFLFPRDSYSSDPRVQLNQVKNLVKRINKQMNKISLELGFDFKVTTYTARHSFSTVMMQHGAMVEMISELLGHQSIKTTQNYLNGFDTSHFKELNNKLIASIGFENQKEENE